MAGPLIGLLLGNIGKVAGRNAQINRENEERASLLQQLQDPGLGLNPQQQQQAQILAQTNPNQLGPLFGQANQFNQQQPQQQVETISSPDRALQLGIRPEMFKKFQQAGILLQRHPDGTIKEAANLPAPLVNNVINSGGSKPVGKDAVKFMMPDGSRASPAMTVDEILSLGGQVVTPESESALKTQANIRAKIEIFDQELERTRKVLNKAREAWEKNKSATNKIRLDNAATAHNLAIAQRANTQGEPSDSVAKQFETPGALGGSAVESLDRVLGGQRDSNVIDFNDLRKSR